MKLRNYFILLVMIIFSSYLFILNRILFKDYDCMNVMKQHRIQVPKTINDSYEWGTSDMYIKVGWKLFNCAGKINTKTVLTKYDKLPREVLIPKLTAEQDAELFKIVKALLEHMRKRNILYFPVFGSLLAAYRNGVSILPWDDDLDLVVDNRDGLFLTKFTDDLTEFKTTDCPLRSTCKMWYLTDEIVITYKSKGVPFKISFVDKYFPVVDITTFQTNDDGYVFTPREELSTGHIHVFKKRIDWIFPLKKSKIKFSITNKEIIEIYLPFSSDKFIQDDYGNDALTTCITSHNHKLFCQDGNCEHVSANHLPKLVFPCSLLEGVL